jgi:hypothetical protein
LTEKFTFSDHLLIRIIQSFCILLNKEVQFLIKNTGPDMVWRLDPTGPRSRNGPTTITTALNKSFCTFQMEKPILVRQSLYIGADTCQLMGLMPFLSQLTRKVWPMVPRMRTAKHRNIAHSMKPEIRKCHFDV